VLIHLAPKPLTQTAQLALVIRQRPSSGYEAVRHFLLDLIVRYPGNTAFIHCFDTGSNFFVPRSFDLAAFSWLIQVEQQSQERQSLVSRQIDDFFGYLFDARGHMNILRRFNREHTQIRKSLISLVVREGLEPIGGASKISNLLNFIAHLSPKIPLNPQIWHWHRGRE
jgi:hypothetical protein